jgi:maltose alpha-D-glucosyltransferase / alpha-amylase
VLFAHNLGDAPARLALTGLPGPVEDPLELFSDSEYDETLDLDDLPLRPYGYRWVRPRRTQVYG